MTRRNFTKTTDLVVALGFIDIHTHTDTSLLVDPRGVSKVAQGVTIDKATFTDPHQTVLGIEYVLVNGKVVVNKRKHTGVKSGHVLRHQA